MLDVIEPWAAWAAGGLELVGVAVIVVCAARALALAGWEAARREDADATYEALRRRLARGILLGLEFLVAGDIVHTVAVELTLRTVGALGIIVLIRTFLSFTIEVETEGRWPWQRGEGERRGG